jgi:hypothetical protein
MTRGQASDLTPRCLQSFGCNWQEDLKDIGIDGKSYGSPAIKAEVRKIGPQDHEAASAYAQSGWSWGAVFGLWLGVVSGFEVPSPDYRAADELMNHYVAEASGTLYQLGC